MTRIAVLISGEYRTFDLCRKTMSFLNHSNVDIFVSTWDKTIYRMPKIDFQREENVTLEQIQKDLGKAATIEIEPHNLFVETRYSSKMIYRWKRGLELIRNSGIEYDYVLVIRPDLHFSILANQTFDFVEKYKDDIGFGWVDPAIPNFLNDIIFMSSYKNIEKLLDNLTVEEWCTAKNDDWHTWWYSFVISHFDKIIPFLEMDKCTFCRPWAEPESTFVEIVQMQQDWNDLSILQLADHVGYKVIYERWPNKVVERAVIKWESNHFDKYAYHYDRNAKKMKVALIISGMLRNYDTAALSLDIWGSCDKFLVTWKSAGQEAIDDYTQLAQIKDSFIIDDAEFEAVYKEPCKNGNNTFRMVYLWEHAFKSIPKDYDKYVIIRPDGFYWTLDRYAVRQCIRTEGPFKTSQTRTVHTNGIDDHILVMDKSHFKKLENCYSELVNTALAMVNDGTATNQFGGYLDPHEMLMRMWNQNIPQALYKTEHDYCSARLNKCVEALWVRNTFTKLKTDKYDRDLYKSVFYDTAAHWRRATGSVYHGTFDRLKKHGKSDNL